jgi:hypothetical protein
MDLGDIGFFVLIVAIFVFIVGGFSLQDIYHVVDDQVNTVEIEVEADEGIFDIEGDGKHKKGSMVTLNAYIYLGWFFDGWYSENGALLSQAEEYTIVADKIKLEAKCHRGYGVEIYAMDGAFYEGRSTYELNETATVEAFVRDDVSFRGWYDIDGNLLSKSYKYTVPQRTDCTLIAKTSGESYHGYEPVKYSMPDDMDPDTITWTITEKDTWDYVDSFSGPTIVSQVVPGVYNITMRGYTNDGEYVKKTTDFMVKGDFEKHYHWKYNNKWYSLTWTLPYDSYESYKNSRTDRWPTTDSGYRSFVNYSSGSVTSIASSLQELGRYMTDVQYVNFVLKFVQLCTDYEYDSDYIGKNEYWKYPAETLFDRRGDCEDSSILYCALMKASGYDAALLMYTGARYVDNAHAAAAVCLPNVPGGTYYEIDGKEYYYCETTSNTKMVGDIWDDYDRCHVVVIN